MPAGEHLARATEAGGDFIKNQQHFILIAKAAQVTEIFRSVNPHASSPLNNRLDDHRCNLIPVFLQQDF